MLLFYGRALPWNPRRYTFHNSGVFTNQQYYILLWHIAFALGLVPNARRLFLKGKKTIPLNSSDFPSSFYFTLFATCGRLS